MPEPAATNARPIENPDLTSVRRWFAARLPIRDALRGYNRTTFRADLQAAATVSLVTIPQAVAFALIAGLPPLMVVMSAVIGGFVAGLLTSSHHMVFGPTNSLSIILAATIYSFAGLALTPPQVALLLALLIGLMQLGAGLAQLGQLTQFISRSVIIGYGTAIAVLLICSQVPHLFGVTNIDRASGLFGSMLNASVEIARGQFNIYSAGIGVGTLLLFHLIKRLFPRAPEEFIGLILLSLLMRFTPLHTLGIRTIADEGALTASLPSFAGMPIGATDLTVVPSLLSAAMAIAILGMLECISISKSLATRAGQRIDANQELISLGAANVANSFFGAMPGSASFARSGANYQSGARTQLAGLMSSGIVLVALLFCAPLVNFIPVPALAAHLARIGWKMIHLDQITIARRSTGSDAAVFWVTLAAAIFLKLDAAIYVGVGTSLALFLRKAASPSLVEYTFNERGDLAALPDKAQRPHEQISIIHVEGELFFGAAEIFQTQMRALVDDEEIKVFILRLKNARHLDATSVLALLELNDFLLRHGRHLIVSGASRDVMRVLSNSGALQRIGAENFFPAESNPTISTKRALERAQELLHSKNPGIRIFYDRPQEKQLE